MKIIALILAIALPAPVLALSCMPHSVETSFSRAQKSDDTYVVVHGRLTFDAKKLPRMNAVRQQDTPDLTLVTAILSGRSLASEGFKVPFDQRLTLEVQCLGPWCASAKSGQDVLAIVRREGNEYAIRLNPCGGDLFGAPQPAMLARVKQCFNGGACEPPAR